MATRIGDYEIRELLGSGSRGKVYRARDLAAARDVALKIPHLGLRDEDFRREAEVLATLHHPNIPTLYAIDTTFMAMELIEGETLQAVMARESDRPKLLDYLRQVAEALQHAHAAGVAHCD